MVQTAFNIVTAYHICGKMLPSRFFRTSVTSSMDAKSAVKLDVRDDYDYEYEEFESVLPRSVQYPMLLALICPSLLAYLFITICIMTSKVFRSAPHNYVFLLILLISFLTVSIDIPISIDRYRPTPTLRLTNSLCLFWWFVDLFTLYTSQFLMAWASFERHLLIFHSNLLNKKWKRLCFHHLPPIIIIVYMFVFYFYAVFIYPCESSVDLEENACPYLCYGGDSFLIIWEATFHGLVPTACTVLFNCALLLRILRSKTRLRQSVNWRKYRTMVFQLMSIAFLYLSINFPFSLCIVLYFTGIQSWTILALDCLDFLFYVIPLLSPLIFVATIPELGNKLKGMLRRQTNGQTTVVPMHTFTKTTRPTAAHI